MKVVSLRISESLHSSIRQKAFDLGISINKFLTMCIETSNYLYEQGEREIKKQNPPKRGSSFTPYPKSKSLNKKK